MTNEAKNDASQANGPLADPECETCVFKTVDYDKEPCKSCVHGRPRGRKHNYVKTDL
jgi:hypothetical protein